MKIVQHGNKYGTIWQCYNCYCIFRYTDDDVYTNFSEFSDIVTDYIRCPECQRKIVIKEKKL